ncbi:MAG TPA: YwiC-like family protein [Candidatus Xenobia bacterium]|nr:YwiC-like family protein [Candidatus Xenobia bacterium]
MTGGTTVILPREHGAWGIVAIPFLSAVVIAGRISFPVLLTALAVLGAFLARYPLELLLIPMSHLRAGRPERSALLRSAAAYGALTLGLGVLLAAVWKLYLLWALAGLGLLLFALRVWWGRRGEDRSLVAELVGTAGLTLSALAGWIAATGTIDASALWIWALNGLFFSSGVLYVKSRIQTRRAVSRADESRAGTVAIVFHVLVLVFVVAVVFARWLSPLVVVPFLLAAVRAAHGIRSAAEARFALRRLGWTEVALSLVFAAFLTLAFQQ